jgi:hypothetical protein
VPVCGLTRVSVKLIRPLRGKVEPSDSFTETSKALLRGSCRRPSAIALLSRSCSFSETLNSTQIGSTCDTVVSSVVLALARLPSDCWARLDRPLIGAVTRV